MGSIFVHVIAWSKGILFKRKFRFRGNAFTKQPLSLWVASSRLSFRSASAPIAHMFINHSIINQTLE